jgi:DedD protein
MSFFNLRRDGQPSKTTANPSVPAESIEIVRKRAKHRLIGSALLVLLGVIGFPLLFDTQPRPVSVGIPVEIPSKQGVKPLSLTAAVEASASAPAPVQMPVAAPAATPVAPEASSPSLAVPSVVKDPATSQVTSGAKAVEKPVDKTNDKANAQATKPADDAARIKVLREGSAPAAAKVSATESRPATAASTAETRLVVQVGAFADVAKAREARLKLEKAGLRNYTQVTETKDGKRIRVRAGPYDTRAEADKAAKQIRALGLPVAILTL